MHDNTLHHAAFVTEQRVHEYAWTLAIADLLKREGITLGSDNNRVPGDFEVALCFWKAKERDVDVEQMALRVRFNLQEIRETRATRDALQGRLDRERSRIMSAFASDPAAPIEDQALPAGLQARFDAIMERRVKHRRREASHQGDDVVDRDTSFAVAEELLEAKEAFFKEHGGERYREYSDWLDAYERLLWSQRLVLGGWLNVIETYADVEANGWKAFYDLISQYSIPQEALELRLFATPEGETFDGTSPNMMRELLAVAASSIQ
jgi:hypothetical protein